MKTGTFTLTFATPAFLGDAEQNGVWRTPPIKALLRQWWRVAYAAQRNFQVDVSAMRREEALLFGHAWLENDHDEAGNRVAARRSKVRLRLDRWDEGRLKRTQWQAETPILHPEVHRNVDAFLYMGYGPVTLPRGEHVATLKKNAAIQANESTRLSMAWPDEADALMQKALWLMDRYGTLGGRSRNGWGSFSLRAEGDAPLAGTLPLRNWTECLDRDWPHALGEDENGALIWQTAPQADWKKAMVELAKIKIGLRTQQFAFTTGKNAPRTEERHWLSYPVTNHSVAAWGNNLRLPNSLRFKVRPAEKGQVVGVIFHVPCLPPGVFYPNRGVIENVWQQVHQFLDTPPNGLPRIQRSVS
ncbi:MAG: hypothetical protein LBR88_03000 [Zoogloeaceae bacterium]|nr:hypothetical protein [Zoogloeaceae bacterium]